jgi:hypothetical protein
MSNNKPLRRGVDGICTRSACECMCHQWRDDDDDHLG